MDAWEITDFGGVEARGARGWVVMSLSCTHPVLGAECLATAWGLSLGRLFGLGAVTDELRAWFDVDPASTGRQLLERLQETYPKC